MKTLTMKKLGVAAAVALISLGLGSAAMANDNSDRGLDDMNATGPNPYMPEFSTPAPHGYSAYGKVQVENHKVNHEIKK